MKGEAAPRGARFISFEGIDGCGKSTLLGLLCKWLDEADISYIVTREPGGTVLGEKIRGLLLDPSSRGMNQQAEVLLYTASRAQLASEVIHPSLQRGLWVISDRYIDATLAYQGYGRGLDIKRLHWIQEWATRSLWPHHTILLDCEVQVAFDRQKERNHKADRIELENRIFHQRVRDGYLDLARSEPERFIVLDAAKPLDAVVESFHTAFWLPLMRATGSPSSAEVQK
jgi:dTMP kinase